MPSCLRLKFCLPVAALACALNAVAAAQQPLYLDTKATAEARAHDLVGRMTLDEKVSQLEDYANAIPRLGIPDYQTWNEALHGVARAGYATVFPQAIGMAATWDPDMVQSEGTVISSEARAKYNEAQRQGNHRMYYGLTFWSPNINIFRDPRWGRGQETYGEDPFLTGRLATAFITGVQGTDSRYLRAVATSKHFAVHSGPETMRHGFNVDPSPRDLEETYLPAFRQTVTEGHVASVMCAYNSIDEWPACANKMLLQDHLRDAWGFKGFVVSDCGAVEDVTEGHRKAPDVMQASALSLNAGTDLSCGDAFRTLAKAVKSGLVSEDLVTQAVERLYTGRFRLGLFDPLGNNPLDRAFFGAVGSAPNRQNALKAADESIVLLKNAGNLLPLLPTFAGKIAVIGPTADLLPSILSNYVGTPVEPTTPLDGMLRQFRSASMPYAQYSNVLYAQGSTLAEGVGIPVPRTAFGLAQGLKTDFFSTPDFTGRPVATHVEPAVQADWENARPVPQIETPNYSVRWSGAITVPAPGHYVFSLEPGDSFPYSPVESYRLLLDGKVVSEGSLRKPVDAERAAQARVNASPTEPPPMQPAIIPVIPFDFADTNPHEFELEYSHSGDQSGVPSGGGLTLKWQAPADALLNQAVAAAEDAEVVVAFVGLSPQLEGEEMKIKIPGFDGGDRTSIDLPAPQQKLLEALAATGKPLVVVLQSGSAVALNWAKEHAQAVLEAWYPGVAGGEAIAQTLAGLNNPAGRLPVTFYASLDGLPAFTDYNFRTEKGGRTYRYFTGKPLWGFGYGLSYSSFTYSALKLSSDALKGEDLAAEDEAGLSVPGNPAAQNPADQAPADHAPAPRRRGAGPAAKPAAPSVPAAITATVTVTNTSAVPGDEVVEVYLKTPQQDGPIQTLAGFQRVSIPAGKSKDVTIALAPRTLSSVDAHGDRSILPGKYTLTVAGAQPQEAGSKAEAAFTVTGAAALSR